MANWNHPISRHLHACCVLGIKRCPQVQCWMPVRTSCLRMPREEIRWQPEELCTWLCLKENKPEVNSIPQRLRQHMSSQSPQRIKVGTLPFMSIILQMACWPHSGLLPPRYLQGSKCIHGVSAIINWQTRKQPFVDFFRVNSFPYLCCKLHIMIDQGVVAGIPWFSIQATTYGSVRFYLTITFYSVFRIG